MQTETETCHCGAEMPDSDHCPCCGCEQFERTCEHQCTCTDADDS